MPLNSNVRAGLNLKQKQGHTEIQLPDKSVTGEKIADNTIERLNLDVGAVARLAVANVTGTYTATIDNDLILCDATGGTFTVNLPTAVGITGKRFWIRRQDTVTTSIVTIDPFGAQTIDGASTFAIYYQGEEIEIVSDGTNWVILTRKFPPTLLEAAATTQQTGGLGADVIYGSISVILTPGTWEIYGQASLSPNVLEGCQLALWNATTGPAEVPSSRSSVGAIAAGGTGQFTTEATLTVTVNTQIQLYGKRNGGSILTIGYTGVGLNSEQRISATRIA